MKKFLQFFKVLLPVALLLGSATAWGDASRKGSAASWPTQGLVTKSFLKLNNGSLVDVSGNPETVKGLYWDANKLGQEKGAWVMNGLNLHVATDMSTALKIEGPSNGEGIDVVIYVEGDNYLSAEATEKSQIGFLYTMFFQLCSARIIGPGHLYIHAFNPYPGDGESMETQGLRVAYNLNLISDDSKIGGATVTVIAEGIDEQGAYKNVAIGCSAKNITVRTGSESHNNPKIETSVKGITNSKSFSCTYEPDAFASDPDSKANKNQVWWKIDDGGQERTNFPIKGNSMVFYEHVTLTPNYAFSLRKNGTDISDTLKFDYLSAACKAVTKAGADEIHQLRDYTTTQNDTIPDGVKFTGTNNLSDAGYFNNSRTIVFKGNNTVYQVTQASSNTGGTFVALGDMEFGGATPIYNKLEIKAEEVSLKGSLDVYDLSFNNDLKTSKLKINGKADINVIKTAGNSSFGDNRTIEVSENSLFLLNHDVSFNGSNSVLSMDGGCVSAAKETEIKTLSLNNGAQLIVKSTNENNLKCNVKGSPVTIENNAILGNATNLSTERIVLKGNASLMGAKVSVDTTISSTGRLGLTLSADLTSAKDIKVKRLNASDASVSAKGFIEVEDTLSVEESSVTALTLSAPKYFRTENSKISGTLTSNTKADFYQYDTVGSVISQGAITFDENAKVNVKGDSLVNGGTMQVNGSLTFEPTGQNTSTLTNKEAGSITLDNDNAEITLKEGCSGFLDIDNYGSIQFSKGKAIKCSMLTNMGEFTSDSDKEVTVNQLVNKSTGIITLSGTSSVKMEGISNNEGKIFLNGTSTLDFNNGSANFDNRGSITLDITGDDRNAIPTLKGYGRFVNKGDGAIYVKVRDVKHPFGEYEIIDGAGNSLDSLVAAGTNKVVLVCSTDTVEVYADDDPVMCSDRGYDLTFYGGKLILYCFDPIIVVTISELGKGTIYSPFNLIVPQGMTVESYGVDLEHKNFIKDVTYTEYDIVPRKKGYVITGTPGTYTFKPTRLEISKTNESCLEGFYVDKSVKKVEGQVYVFDIIKEMPGFYKYTGETLGANKAFFRTKDNGTQQYNLGSTSEWFK